MKYEEIKVGESYTVNHEKEKVVAKIDEYKYIITTNENGDLTAWLEEESENFSPIKEEPILTQVANAVQEISDFRIEQTKSGVIILTPKNK